MPGCGRPACWALCWWSASPGGSRPARWCGWHRDRCCTKARAASACEADGRPGLWHRLTAPGQAFDGQLIGARAQRRAVELDMQVAAGITLQVVLHADP